MSIWFNMGTAGELIKMYPLMQLAEEQGIPWMAVHTGQSGLNYWRQWEDFGFPRNKSVSTWESDSDLTTSGSAMTWFFKSMVVGKNHLMSCLNANEFQKLNLEEDYYFIHGDTLSTFLGAIYARRLGMTVVHVEAGLRSKFLFQPFPEEINRRLTSELTHWHMVPDPTARHNLLKAGFEDRIVDSGGNTLIDAIRRTLIAPSDYQLPSKPYVVANLHRHENLTSEKRWKRLVEVVLLAQENHTVYFAMHAPAEAKLKNDLDSKARLEEAGVQLIPRMKFTEFIRLLNGADYVLSDGGSNQEECYYLGKPCLILREATERIEGLGENALLSKFHIKNIKDFLLNYKAFEREPIDLSIQPSKTILESLGLF